MSPAKIREKLRQFSSVLENNGPCFDLMPHLQVLRDEIAAQGWSTAYVSYLLAVAADRCGDLRVAVDAIVDATTQDPVNPAFQHSLRLITGNVSNALMDADDSDVAEFVGHLERLGSVPVPARMRQAEVQLNAGDVQGAARLVHAASIIDPRSPETLRMFLKVTELLGSDWLQAANKRVGFGCLKYFAPVPPLPPREPN